MHYIQHLIYFHLNICTRWIMTSKKTAYIPFWNMMHFYIFEHWQILCFCPWFGIIDGIWHNSILKQIPLSEQNIFSNYVCKLLNYHLKSSDRIKPFQIKSICNWISSSSTNLKKLVQPKFGAFQQKSCWIYVKFLSN